MEGIIEEVAGSPGDLVTYGEYERITSAQSMLVMELRLARKEVPELGVIEHEDLPATGGSIMSSPICSKSQLEVYRNNAALLRAAD